MFYIVHTPTHMNIDIDGQRPTTKIQISTRLQSCNQGNLHNPGPWKQATKQCVCVCVKQQFLEIFPNP